MGNRKTKTDNNGTANYTYDTLNRLITATNPLPSNPLESFTYDAVGNRTDSNQNGLSTFNNANQLLDDANFTYSYDNNGNLIQKTDKLTGAFTLFEYDAENKLIRVVKPDGIVVNYKYDGLGRRVEKEIADFATTITRYVYDQEDILLELDGLNNIVARYTHGQGIDEPLIMERGGASFFYHADGLGSITELTDTIGAVIQAYNYSSFGKIESQLDPNFIQPYTFTAREFDPETDLYFYRARYYDPVIGRFLQVDPIGFAGGINLYGYVGNNPVNFLDPLGLAAEDFTVFTILAKIEKVGSRFVVAGGAAISGTALLGAGVVASGALIIQAPATAGVSLVALPATGLVTAAGVGLIAFSFDIYLNELNAFLGTKVRGPGDFFPDVFPRFEPIFKESIFQKINRLVECVRQAISKARES